MRKIISIFLAAVLLLSVMSTTLVASASEIPKGATAVNWIAAGDHQYASAKLDNTRDYEFGYDISFPNIGSCTTPDTWADNTWLVIRNEVLDDYLKIELQSYCNGDGQYQVAAAAMVWTGDSWSERDFRFSPTSATPIENVHMVVTYAAESSTFAWTLTDKATGAVLDTNTFDPSRVTEDLKGCADCAVYAFAVTPENTYVKYAGGAGGDDTPDFDENKTPADFGWTTDGANFVNWQTTSEGDMYYVNYNGANSQRIWKNLIADSNNFTLKMTVKVEEHRAYIELLGVAIELDCNGGNGNQICEKFSGSYQWLTAAAQTCEVTVARANGGDLNIKFLGKGNPTPMTFTVTPTDESKTEVVIGVYDNPGAAYFSDITAMGLEGQNVSDFGWETDEVAGEKNYSGWTSVDGVNITANYEQTVASHRIWKNLITDENNFSVRVTAAASATTSAYVKLLGQTVELDGRGGNGSQLNVKLNGVAQDWVDADACTAELFFTRKDGEIGLSVLGKNQSAHSYRIAASESNENLELGVYAGTVTFSNILVKKASDCMRAIPFTTSVFAGDMAGNWISILRADIDEYQNSILAEPVITDATADAILAPPADLIVIADGVSKLLSGKSADAYLADYTALLNAVMAGRDDGAVVVITSLSYMSDAALGSVSIDTVAEINARLRALAEKSGALYADLYSAMGNRGWTVQADGRSFSKIGETLVAGEVLEELMRACSCLAVNSTTPLRTTLAPVTQKTEAALNAFKSASTADAMAEAVANRALGLNLVIYNMLTSANQTLVCNALVQADRSAVADFTAADALFTRICMRVTREHPLTKVDKEITTILTVGASCTEGTAAVNQKTDAWPIRLGDSLDIISPNTYTVINKGIAGMRMCTMTDNGMFPAAKDTVDEYIVSVNPDLLLITYGFNDINAGTMLEEYITTFRAYLDEIKSKCPETVIVLAGIQPTFEETNLAVATQWSASIKALAEEKGCIFATTYDDVGGVNWLISDGVHPTNAGYRVKATAYLRILNAYIDFTGTEPLTPADFGWETDEISGAKDFSGWTATDAENIGVNYDQTTGNHRIWKSLLTNQSDFTATMNITASNVTSTYLKLLGVTLELDGNGGDGNQVFVKLNGENKDWLTSTGCEATVNITRTAGGELNFTLTGKDNDTPMTFTVAASEPNENLELGLYRGMAKFTNINVVCETACEHDWVLDEAASTTATCTAAGTNVYTCSKCDETKSETVAALGHDLITDAAAAATCTETGLTEGSHCSRCDYKVAQTVTQALGHAWDEGKVTTAPTATEKGVKTYSCTRCDATRTEEIPAMGEWENPFTDVPAEKWYTSAVEFAVTNGLFTGTSETTFAPNGNMTRTMLVTVLWRLDGKQEPKGSNTFTDVKAGRYYTSAVTWAAENEIVNGVGDGKFNPDGNVTREQMAAILYRYAGKKGYDTAKRADLSGFPDAGQISKFAKDALSWANAEGLITGSEGKLLPKGNATRAQVAAILMRYVNNIVKK